MQMQVFQSPNPQLTEVKNTKANIAEKGRAKYIKRKQKTL